VVQASSVNKSLAHLKQPFRNGRSGIYRSGKWLDIGRQQLELPENLSTGSDKINYYSHPGFKPKTFYAIKAS